MKKIFITLIFALLAATSAWAQTTFTVDNLNYTITDATAETVELTGYATRLMGPISIPASVSYQGTSYTVTSIGERAFENSNAITIIVIPNGVTSIGQEAFIGCEALGLVTIPASVTSIGYSAFHGCSALTKITIPEGVTTIENGMFDICTSLTQVTLPNSLTSIGQNAFYGCSSLTTITIPDNVTSIGQKAFYGCFSLTAITIPDNVTSIGEYAFLSCSALTTVNIGSGVTNVEDVFENCTALTYFNVNAANTTYSSVNGILFNKDETTLVYYPIGKPETTYTVPAGVNTIGRNAFAHSPTLTKITIPASVTSIGNNAFYNCAALTQIILLATVPPTIESTDALGRIDIPIYVPATALAAYQADEIWNEFTNLQALGATTFTADGLKYTVTDETANTVELTGYVTEPTGTLSIPATVSYESTTYNVTSIKKKAFENCTALTSVTVANGVTNIGENVFSGCSALAQITLPESLTSIGNSAFQYCSALTAVTIPASVTSIGNLVFGNCTALTQINVDAANTAYCSENGILFNKDKTTLICYPAAKTGTDYTVPASVTVIGEMAFAFCSNLTQITLPEGLTYIGNYAFFYCTALTHMTVLAPVPPTVDNVNAFSNVNSEITVFVPLEAVAAYQAADIWKNFTNLLAIGSDTFTIDKLIYTVTDVVANTAEVTGYESGLAGEVDIPATITYASKTYTVTSIGKRAFEECEAITTVTIPEGVTNIGQNAFYGCTALTAVTIPNSVTSIEEKAFYGCEALEAITIPAGMTSIGYSAFYGCTALTAVTIPASVTSIENLVFENCTSLTQINVDAANTVYSSENGVLFNKDKTTLICYPAGKTETDYTVPDGVTTIGENAFAYAIFTQITLPESLTAIEYYAFYDCTALTQMTVLATVPPTVASHYVFNNVNYRIPVYVPAESLDDYKEADVWKEFSNLQALQTGLQTPSMPESIRMQDGMLHNPQGLHLTLYDMQGRQVYSGTAATVSQPAGVYVVRCNGASGKVVF